MPHVLIISAVRKTPKHFYKEAEASKAVWFKAIHDNCNGKTFSSLSYSQN